MINFQIPRAKLFTAARILSGLVLVAAGVLKCIDAQPLSITTGIAEALLGAFLLAGTFQWVSRIVAVFFFAMGSVANLVLVLRAADSCGCLGSVEMSPYVMLVFDLTLMLFLMLGRPCNDRPRSLLRAVPPIAVLPVAFFLGVLMPFSNESVSSEADDGSQNVMIVDVGYVMPSTTTQAVLKLDRSAAVKHVSSECECLEFIDAHSDAKGQPKAPKLQLTAPARVGPYVKRLTITFEDDQEPLIVEMRARVGLPLAVVPSTLVVNPSHPDVVASVRVVNDGDQPVTLGYSTSDHRGCQAATSGIIVPAKGGAEVKVKLGAPTDLPARIAIKTDSNVQPEIDFRVEWATSKSE